MAKKGLTNDIGFSPRGQMAQMTGTEKVRQLIIKALLTDIETNPFIPNYGSKLGSIVGDKFDSLAEFKIHDAVQEAIRFLQQEQQSQTGLPLNETILGVQNIEIAQERSDPRIIRVKIDVQTGSFENVTAYLSIVNI